MCNKCISSFLLPNMYCFPPFVYIQETLLEFLTCSRLMLQHAENVLTREGRVHVRKSMSNGEIILGFDGLQGGAGAIPASNSYSSLPKTGVASRSSIVAQSSLLVHTAAAAETSVTRAPDSDAQSTRWMAEMQKEFNFLVDLVVPILLPSGDRTPQKFMNAA
jgi:hypothetical protein